jgi:hypothetical protein
MTVVAEVRRTRTALLRSGVRGSLLVLTVGIVATGSLACELTTDLSGLHGGPVSGGRAVGDAEDEPSTVDVSSGDASFAVAFDSGVPTEDAGGDSAVLSASTTDASTTTGFDSGVPIGDAGGESAKPDASAACPISVTQNTFDTSYDGYITYVNTGRGSEINPTVEFTVPSGVTLYTSGCLLGDQGVPGGITALSCCQTGTTFTYAFTGTILPGEQVALYYTTSAPSEPVATNISVTAASCP